MDLINTGAVVGATGDWVGIGVGRRVGIGVVCRDGAGLG